ncbi:hypothetical protein ABIC66_000766 [Caulobacter sp. 1776]
MHFLQNASSVTAKNDIIDLTLRPATELNHFPDAGKMVFTSMAGLNARILGLSNDGKKVVPLGVAKQNPQITTEPIFVTVIVELSGGFKRRH